MTDKVRVDDNGFLRHGHDKFCRVRPDGSLEFLKKGRRNADNGTVAIPLQEIREVVENHLAKKKEI